MRVDHFGKEEIFSGDIVVLAVGSKPNRILLEQFQDGISKLEAFYMIGDCVEPRTALEAIHEGARIAREI